MTHSQNTPAPFSPFNGRKLRAPLNVNEQHWRAEIHVWHFNPWTGAKRNPLDVESDPRGLLIRPAGEVLLAAPKADVVNHPSHYTAGKVECIDALEAATTGLEGIEAVCTANAIKYLWRWKQKNGKQDLQKARWYINRLLGEEASHA